MRSLKIKFYFRNQRSITFFVNFLLLLFDNAVCLPFQKGNELNLQRNHKSIRKKKIEPEYKLQDLRKTNHQHLQVGQK